MIANEQRLDYSKVQLPIFYDHQTLALLLAKKTGQAKNILMTSEFFKVSQQVKFTLPVS